MITPITKTKMTTLTIRMAKMGPRKAPKNTAGSLMKQLEEKLVHKSSNKVYVLFSILGDAASFWGGSERAGASH